MLLFSLSFACSLFRLVHAFRHFGLMSFATAVNMYTLVAAIKPLLRQNHSVPKQTIPIRKLRPRRRWCYEMNSVGSACLTFLYEINTVKHLIMVMRGAQSQK